MTIAIFRPGPHFPPLTDAELEKTVAAYDPALHEAPLVFGHPSTDAPAYGWVQSLVFSEGLLRAAPRQVAPALKDSVASGAHKKISAAFYRPDVPQNPVQGVYYLRHVGFLGAQPPEVKGLPAVEFADTADDWVSIEFGEASPYVFRTLNRLFRRLRDHLIGQADLETADRVLPDWDVQALADEAERLLNDDRPQSTIFSEDDVTQPGTGAPAAPTAEDLARRQAELDAREQSLGSRETAIQASAAQASRRQALTFVEDLVTQGRILPRDKDALVEFIECLPAEATVTFAEGDATIAKPGEAQAFFRQFLGRLPVQVNFQEVSAPEGDGTTAPATAGLRLPKGDAVDPERAELHQRVLAFAEKHGVSYDQALSSVASLEG